MIKSFLTKLKRFLSIWVSHVTQGGGFSTGLQIGNFTIKITMRLKAANQSFQELKYEKLTQF